MSLSSQPSAIFSLAKTQAKQLGLSYAGAVTPPQAYHLHQAQAAYLVDVRTGAELAYVGRIANTINIQWQIYPMMEINIHFVAEMEQAIAKQKTLPLLFICRSGARSHFAALKMATLGYETYNVLQGFEGELSASGHRNEKNGWRWHKLPWTQS